MKKTCFISILIALFPYIGLAQNIDNKQRTIYTLSPLLDIKPKIYVINELNLRKHQLPQNYMIVRNPLENMVTLWEFPNEFPASQVKQTPTLEQTDKTTKNILENPKKGIEQKSLSGLEQTSKLLESAGLGSDKEISNFDLKKLLPGVGTDKK